MTHLIRRRPFVAALAALALSSATVDAQVFDLAGTTNNRGFHHPSSDRNMARHGTRLYAAVVLQNGTVQIRRRQDTTTPADTWVVEEAAVNTTSSGIGTTNPTTTVSMAVSGTGHLHITWARYYYSVFYRQYYRCYSITSGAFTHAVQDITALAGANSSTRTDSMAIAVGAKDKVYLTAPNGTQSWRSRLLQSGFVSFPTGLVPAWINRGSIAANTASSQNVSMAVDTRGLVHMSFYNNVAPGRYATRYYDPGTNTWGAQDFVGVPTVPRDNDGYIATGINGRTHVLYRHTVSIVSGVTNFQLLYRRRNGTGAWSAPIVVYEFDSTMSGSSTSYGTFALAVGRRVFAIYREFDCGRLMVKRINFGATAFKFYSELRPASSTANDYYMPSVRATLWPQGNNQFRFMDVSFRRPVGSTFRLYHQRLEVREIWIDMAGCVGSCGEPQITLGGVPASSAPRTVEIGVEQANPGSSAILLYGLSGTTAIPFGCGTLYATSPFWPVLTVNPCCSAKHTVPLPPGGYGTWFYFQWAVSDSGWKLSNRGRMRL